MSVDAKALGYVDIHTHVIPGVDDGAETMEMTLEMLKKSYDQGVRVVIATPHYEIGSGEMRADELKTAFDDIRKEVEKKFDDMQIYLGNEILYSEGVIARLEDGRALTLAKSRYVLVEYRIKETYSNIKNSVIALQRQRYHPIIAHVERYENVMKDKRRLQELKDMGALLQVNCASVKKCMKYIKRGWIDFLATDCHNLTGRAPNMEKAATLICKVCDEEISRNILGGNAEAIFFRK